MKRNVFVNYCNLRPGLWLHFRSYGFFGRGIRFFLSIFAHRAGLKGCWGNHDAMLARHGDDWYAGESTPRGGVLTPFSEYQTAIAAGECEMRVYQVRGCPTTVELKAATNWVNEHKGRMYDFRGIIMLAFKCVFGRLNDKLRDWEFASWCTESVNDAYADAMAAFWGVPSDGPLRKRHPTPLTVEIRAGQAGKQRSVITLEDITAQVLTVEPETDDGRVREQATAAEGQAARFPE